MPLHSNLQPVLNCKGRSLNILLGSTIVFELELKTDDNSHVIISLDWLPSLIYREETGDHRHFSQ